MMENKKTLGEQLKNKPYTLRLPNFFIDQLNKYAELTGEQTTEVVRSILFDFMKGKQLTNSYLNIKPLSIEIPVLKTDKSKANNLLSGYEYERAEIITINKSPNNVDTFDKDKGFNTDGKHTGIEFFVLPNAYDPKTYDVMNTLYILFFITDNSLNVERINLISNVEAINLLSSAKNETDKKRLFKCINSLKRIEKDIRSHLEKDGDLKQSTKYSINYQLRSIAERYNNPDIISVLSDDIIPDEPDEAIKEDIIAENNRIKIENEELRKQVVKIENNFEEKTEKLAIEVVNNVLSKYMSKTKQKVNNEKSNE